MSSGKTSASVSSIGSAEELRDSGFAYKEVVLAWRNLSVHVTKKSSQGWFLPAEKEDHLILKNVNGYCKSGQLTAVMGASGAGKTTLLATVSQRAKFRYDGEILVNGSSVPSNVIGKISGFVPQYDLVFKTLTVSEHMEFMAYLMMDQRLKRIHRNRRIYCLLTELGLLRARKTRLASLSGGEMKRLSLAVQMLTDPPLLFCDEPTSGLDSYSAGVVLQHLRDCAERGKAVLATIHQPASGHFDLFHEVILLADGKVAYAGPVAEASSYFNSVGMVCPSNYNPAEFYVQQLAVLPGMEKECLLKNNWVCDEFSKSARGIALEETIIQEVRHRSIQTRGLVKGNWSTHSSTTTDSLLSTDDNNAHVFQPFLNISRPSVATQLYLLLWRSYLDLTRSGADIVLRFVLLLLVGTIISTPYIGVISTLNQKTIQNMQGLMYLSITEVVFTFSYNVFHTFPREIPILLRELANGLYRPGPYYFSKLVITSIRAIIEGIVFATFVFCIVRLDGGFVGYYWYTNVIVFAGLAASAFGTVMSAGFESVSTASLVSVPYEFVTLLFSGLYLHLSTVPSFITWLKYISIFFYGLEAVSITQWFYVRSIECSDDTRLPCISDGLGVLKKYGYNPDNYGNDILGLIMVYTLANLLGFFALWLRGRKSPTY